MTNALTMRAVVALEPGGVDRLCVVERPVPALQPGHVAIAVAATALNRADLLQRRGLHPPPAGVTDVLGLECSGRIAALASDVRHLRVGEPVMALLPGGGYAERVVAPADLVMRAPESLSLERAAAVPEAFLTASEVLFELGRLRAGHWVLIHAAASGVGSAAVQLARAEGARVIAVVGSDAKAAAVRELGADAVLDRHRDDLDALVGDLTAGAGVDVALDFVGAAQAGLHQRRLAEGGRWLVVGLLGGAKAEIDLGVVLRRRLSILGFALRSRSLAEKAAIVQRFEDRFRLRLESGALAPVIDREFELDQVQQAHERMERNENVGKILLRVGAHKIGR